jgi:hypothetical protein
VSSLDPPDHDGWLTKQGGSIKTWKRRWFVLKGRQLYYFKGQSDAEETGLVELEPTSFVREEPAKSSKRKYMLSIGTQKRVFYMYSEVKSETDAWVAAINRSIKGTAPLSVTPAATAGHAATTRTAAARAPGQLALSAAEGPGAGVSTLALPSSLLPFIKADSQISEFFTIWKESVPPDAQVSFDLTVSTSSLDDAMWRVVGPQSGLIQKMVDFFWNVGAPEEEIDKLNDIGALLNPAEIGSFVEMSEPGGMDGGWFFPIPAGSASLDTILEAADESEASSRLAEFGAKHGLGETVVAVGRDMGAAPPRQTDILFDTLQSVETAYAAFDTFGFPSIPGSVKEALAKSASSKALRVVLSSDGFVRLAIVLSSPPPTREDVARLTAALELGSIQDGTLRDALGEPSSLELQYLSEGFGYGVYKTAWDVKEVFSLGANES